jgi:hypothetical protein
MPAKEKKSLVKKIKRTQRTRKVKKQQKSRQQKGGKAPSCLVKPNVSKYVDNSCHTANLHNTNPEVDYSLITDTGMSGGACPPNVKPMTFKNYLQDVAGKLGGDVDSVSKGDLEQQMAGVDGHPSGAQAGAGYSTNPEQQISGMPVYDKYDDCCHPASVGGKLVEGGKAGAICGNQMGGKNKKRRTHKRNNATKSKSRTQKNKKSKGKRNGKKQRGGSRPADYPNESHSGLNSDFDPSGKGKNFAGKQPFWGAKTR